MATSGGRLLAVPDSLLTVAGLVVAVIVLVLLVMSFGSRRAGRNYDVSPPHSGQRDDRKPHE